LHDWCCLVRVGSAQVLVFLNEPAKRSDLEDVKPNTE
jgi:hypothetical protein